jgi:hypothetical protein
VTRRILILAAAVAAAVAAVVAAAPAPAARAPALLQVWAVQRTYSPPVPVTGLSSYFDVTLPDASVPGRWDVAYDLSLRQARPSSTRQVAVWVHYHNRIPAGHLAAHPVIYGQQWNLYAAGAAGPVTFTLPYAAELTAAQFPARRWTYGTVHLQAMLRWLSGHGYLPRRAQLAGLSFGWEFASAGGASQVFTLQRFSLTGPAA